MSCTRCRVVACPDVCGCDCHLSDKIAALESENVRLREHNALLLRTEGEAHADYEQQCTENVRLRKLYDTARTVASYQPAAGSKTQTESDAWGAFYAALNDLNDAEFAEPEQRLSMTTQLACGCVVSNADGFRYECCASHEDLNPCLPYWPPEDQERARERARVAREQRKSTP